MLHYSKCFGSATMKPYDESAYDVVRIYERDIQRVSTDYPEIEPQAEFRCCRPYYAAFDRA